MPRRRWRRIARVPKNTAAAATATALKIIGKDAIELLKAFEATILSMELLESETAIAAALAASIASSLAVATLSAFDASVRYCLTASAALSATTLAFWAST